MQLAFNSVWETLDYMDKFLQQLQPAEDGSSMDYNPFYHVVAFAGTLNKANGNCT